MSKTITVTVPFDVRDEVQRYDIERSSRRDLIAYILSNDALQVSPDKLACYQAEYDEKFAAFEKAKNKIETNYVQPAANNKAINWSLDYESCIITITVDE